VVIEDVGRDHARRYGLRGTVQRRSPRHCTAVRGADPGVHVAQPGCAPVKLTVRDVQTRGVAVDRTTEGRAVGQRSGPGAVDYVVALESTSVDIQRAVGGDGASLRVRGVAALHERSVSRESAICDVEL